MVGRHVRIAWAMLLGYCFCSGLLADEAPIQRWDRVVCLVEKHIDKENNQVKHEWSTAFLVHDGEHVLLVGTAHGAHATSRETTVVFRRPDGTTGEIVLADLYQAEGNPWRTQATSDMAVMRIEAGKEPSEVVDELLKLAIPLECIQAALPKRTTPVELTGFPLGLGVKGLRSQSELSSIVICGQIASREIPTPAKWGVEKVFIIQLAGAGGISGAPVFLAEESPESVSVVGMAMGTIREDSTGITMNRIIPGRIIVDAVKSSYSKFSP